jgi:hypothetical protein
MRHWLPLTSNTGRKFGFQFSFFWVLDDDDDCDDAKKMRMEKAQINGKVQ